MLRYVLAATLFAGVMLISHPQAVANDGVSCGRFSCAVEASSPAQSAGPVSIPQDEGSGGGVVASCRDGAQSIPCQSEHGTWSSGNGCYMAALQGVPSSVPGGQGPGSWYSCTSAEGFASVDGAVWLPQAQAPPPQLADPRVLAQSALERLPLATPEIQTAPSPPDMSYVTLDTWLWMDPGQFTTVSQTATAGPTSVTATARPVMARWTTGDGGSTTCSSPGRPWTAGLGESARTDCSYTWDMPSTQLRSGAYELTATLLFDVRWTCSGACLITGGSLGQVPGPTASGAIRVGERQSVVVGS